MVKVGFICEGRTEKMILDSMQFRELLLSLNIEIVEDVIDVKGNGNLLPKHLEAQSKALFVKGAEHIVILTDRDAEPCITTVRERVLPPNKHSLVVAVQQVEAWFLADTIAIRSLIGDAAYEAESPESHEAPFEELRLLLVAKTGRGIPTKRLLAKRILKVTTSPSPAQPSTPIAQVRLTLYKS